MVDGIPAVLVRVPLDQGKVDHPRKDIAVTWDEPEAPREVHPEAAENRGGNRGAIPDEQEQVAGFGTEGRQQARLDALEESRHRRLEPVRIHLDPDEALG